MYWNFLEYRIITSPCIRRNGGVERDLDLQCPAGLCSSLPPDVFSSTGTFICFDDLDTCGEGKWLYVDVKLT